MRSISAVPPLRGYVLTGARGEPAQIGLVSAGDPPDPILAWWNHGLGRGVAFTSDLGGRWTPAWATWPGFQPFVGGMVRWMLRPTAPGDVLVRSRLEGDEAIVPDPYFVMYPQLGALTGGKNIAGTGTVNAEGTVGPIGGIRQKMYGAQRSGATHFLAPIDNCSEVVGHIPTGLTVISVRNFEEALAAVETIARGSDLSRLGSCGTN